MKLALRYIPAEVWVDIFCYPWISRRKLSKIVGRFRNRYIAEILQYCLHERGKRTLSGLELDKTTLPCIPRTPMPENIKFFKHIAIRHFDTQTLDFLRRISTLFISNDVNLRFGFEPRADLAHLRTILGYLTPMLHGIYALSFHQSLIPLVEQHFGQKLAQLKMLSIKFHRYCPHPTRTIRFALNWLTLDGRDHFVEPRFLKVLIQSKNFQQFIMAVQQQFHSAKSQCTFAIELSFYGYGHHNIDLDYHLELENNIGEQLQGQFYGVRYFRIYRHPINFARTKQEKWVEQTIEKRNQTSSIRFVVQLTIGPIDANAGANQVNVVGDDEADQPSTSNKH